MSNYKALGIEKDMNEAFSIYLKSDLQLLIDSTYFECPYIKSRDGGEYAEIEVISCDHESWWYKDLIGFTFLTEIKYQDFGRGRFIKEFIGVQLTNTKKIIFRSFKPSDVIIL